MGVFFMADIVFVAGDLSTARPEVGAWLAAGLTLLAVPKAWLAVRLIESPKRGRVVMLVAVQMAVIAALPVVLKVIAGPRGGALPLPAVYAAWWMVGLLPIFMTAVLTFRSAERLNGLATAYVLVPYAAVVGHLLACTWVYKLPFYAASYAPVLVGLAVSAGMLRNRIREDNAIVLEWLSAVVAILLAVNADPSLTGSVHLTPLRLTAAAAGLVNLHGLIVTGSSLFSMTLACLALGAALGPGRPYVSMAFRSITKTLARAYPQSRTEWGLWAVATSFLLLLAGAMLSLRRRKT